MPIPFVVFIVNMYMSEMQLTHSWLHTQAVNTDYAACFLTLLANHACTILRVQLKPSINCSMCQEVVHRSLVTEGHQKQMLLCYHHLQ